MRIFTAILIAAMACFWTAPAWAKRVALVIGNAAYDHAPNLRNPGNDADDMADALTAVGFEVAIAHDLNKTEMEQALQEFSRTAAGADTAIIFYAGHGIGVGGQSWLLPVSANLEREGDEAFQAIPLDYALRAVEGASGLRLVILDACRDNPFASTMAPRADGTRSVTRGLNRVEPRGDTLVWYAAKDGSVAADGRTRNSPFTEALLTHMPTPGLELGTVFRRVVSDVRSATGRAQEPTQYGSRGADDFFFQGDDKGLTRPDPKPDPKLDPDPSGLSATEQEAWAAYELVRSSGSIVALRRIAERYPGTIAADAAAADADELERAASLQGGAQGGVQGGGVQGGVVSGRADRMREAEEREWRTLALGDDVEGLVAFLEIYPDGVYADDARTKLIGLYREGQTELKRLGLYRFRVDGDWGQGSREALRAFQRAKNRSPADGILTGPLLADLRNEPSAPDGMRDGETFRDCPECPQMVVVPAGSFVMGSPTSERSRDDDEGPQRTVRVAKFAAGQYEVTRGQFRAFVEATGYSTGSQCWVWNVNTWEERFDRSWRDVGYTQADSHPVACVSWNDAQAYTRWLSSRTGHEYRLLSEAEWEYGARAGTTTLFAWGTDQNRQCGFANAADRTAVRTHSNWGSADCDDGYLYSAPVGRLRPNAFGLYDMGGNIWEIVQDCWNESYSGAPRNSEAWMSGDCTRAVRRGGAWDVRSISLRSAHRVGVLRDIRLNPAGFRVARTIRNVASAN